MTYSLLIKRGFALALCLAMTGGWGCSDECASGQIRSANGSCVERSSDAATEEDSLTDGGDAAVDAAQGGEEGVDSSTDMAMSCISGCADPLPVCDAASGQCVACLIAADCTDERRPLCVDQRCIGCTSNEDCGTANAPLCDSETSLCVGCQSDDDCAGHMDGDRALAVCDVEAGACVECTGTRFEACGQGESGASRICDSTRNRCSSQEARNGEICRACISDAQCPAGSRCVQEEFAGQLLAHVCLPVESTEEEGAVPDCFEAGRPYRRRRVGVESIDGDVQDICALHSATCSSMQDHGLESCAALDDSSPCGETELLEDAVCNVFDFSSAPICLVPCVNSKDCMPGYACNTKATPSYCELEPDTCYVRADCPGEDQQCDPGTDRCVSIE